ncbi:MAG: hypothetical protein GXP24_02655 [Planctomycetes bacterium]|nr:hypothetical protein [Planctomycetota bacterium]
MTQIPNVNSAPAGNQAFGKNNSLNELDMSDFLNLMIVELQNQDPLNPLDNAELIAQIGQIREVGATESLTETLDSVLLGQNISSATNLIGADVVALNDDGERVSGNVRVVTITNGQPTLDLAIESAASAADEPGEIESGNYTYEVVWESDTGVLFGTEIDAHTNDLTNFQGTIQLNNLPETSTEKRIYRTDGTDDGDRKLVGTIPNGKATVFVDGLSDANRGETLTARVQKVDFASKVTVPLNSVGEIRPPKK